MSAQPFVQFYPSDFLNGIWDLSPNEIAVYTVILMSIYDQDGPIPDEPAKIARRCNMRRPQCEKSIQSLVNDGKLTRIEGRIGNKRAEKELEKRREKSAKQSQNAQKRWQQEAEKPNENNEPDIPPHSDGTANDMPTRNQKLEVRNQKDIEERFEDFREAYPKRDGADPRKTALAAFTNALKRHPGKVEQIIDGARLYALSMRSETNRRLVAQSTTFLNQDRWQDELEGHRTAEVELPMINIGPDVQADVACAWRRMLEAMVYGSDETVNVARETFASWINPLTFVGIDADGHAVMEARSQFVADRAGTEVGGKLEAAFGHRVVFRLKGSA